jgi:SAM-dependent methyltransferase
MTNKWPKIFPPLTSNQQVVNDDFVKHWHEILPKKFGVINRFNHTYVVKHSLPDFKCTLEIGGGDGEHLNYESLNNEQKKNYTAIDIRQNMVTAFKENQPGVNCIVGDIQSRTPMNTDSFDRVIAIHVLEHLPDLPSAIAEIYRLIDKDKGQLSVVIPCEGSLAYWAARKISAERIFKKRYHMSYGWFISREHINKPKEIIEELSKRFCVTSTTYFPIPIKVKALNLCIGLTLEPK